MEETRPAILALLLVLLGGCAEPPVGTRRIVTTAWDTLWQTTAAFGDSVIPSPDLLAYNAGQLYVYDVTAHRVTALEAGTGAVVWQVGRRGQGPGEYEAVASILPGPGGGLGIVGSLGGWLSWLSTDGTAAGRLPTTRAGAQANQACRIEDERLLFADAFSPWLRITGADGTRQDSVPPLWPDLAALGLEAHNVMLRSDSAGARCMIGLFSGRGFGLRTPAHGLNVAAYIEPLEAFRTGTRRDEPELEYWGPVDADFSGDTLWILFAGRTGDRYRLLDRYAAPDGRYLDSYLLPFPSIEFAVGAGLVFAVDSSMTSILALRPRRR